ncbi:MAG: hypothetical protein CR981_01820 [Proteobacteria bacterium]|nr:MAG: hypothetical protein CR981_01820 [Pseudomonadota bacterium]
MEIIIGSSSPIGSSFPQPVKDKDRTAVVEAELLHVRPSRRGIAGPSGMERRSRDGQDPTNGRVLTIMVKDSNTLPKDIDTARYQVLLRFLKK